VGKKYKQHFYYFPKELEIFIEMVAQNSPKRNFV